MLKLGINGFGRIGRCVLRALYEGDYRQRMQVVAINEPSALETIAHLTRFDTTHGRFPGSVTQLPDGLLVNGDRIRVSHVTDPAEIDWQGVDLVLECSGSLCELDALQAHQRAGAPRVLLSQPGSAELPAIVFGVNHAQLDRSVTLASAASCTSNCIVPVIALLDQAFGIDHGSITTVHSAMHDQPVIDAYHATDLHRTRAASASIIPVSTGLANGIGRVLPHLAGRFTAQALRVPTLNVSAMELVVQVRTATSATAVNACLRQASDGVLAGVLGYTEEPLVSCDFNHDPRSGIVDAGQTRVAGEHLVQVLVWFDNEWAYANRMLDSALHWLADSDQSA